MKVTQLFYKTLYSKDNTLSNNNNNNIENNNENNINNDNQFLTQLNNTILDENEKQSKAL